MSYIAVVNIISGIVYTICIFIFINRPEDYLQVPLLSSLLSIISGTLGLYIAFKKFHLKFILQKYADLKREIKTGWDIFISILAINAYTSSRVFAVGLLTNNVLTGNIIQTFFRRSGISRGIHRGRRIYSHLDNPRKNNKKNYCLKISRILIAQGYTGLFSFFVS